MSGDGIRAAVVLELPELMAVQIRRIQARFDYGQGSPLPVHITLAGSNGLGELELEEDASAAFSTLDAIARAAAPIFASFGPVMRFPGTDTFALTLLNEGPIMALHRKIAESGLRFGPSPFPFKPHCTLTSRTPMSDAETASLLAAQVRGTFVLESVSVCAMGPPMALLHRTSMSSRQARASRLSPP